VLVGLSGKKDGEAGVVVNMEIRRRSGRGVVENFVMIPPIAPASSTTKCAALSEIMLLVLEQPLRVALEKRKSKQRSILD